MSASVHPARGTPALSLILCSRNDRYMGHSLWRLETTLNFVARRVREAGLEARVEVVVADWGSDVPLSQVLRLSPAASALVSFLEVPSAIARAAQGDSPFAEVIALNAAARRATGAFIGRIDQDTLVGSRFFQVFFRLVDGRLELDTPLERTLFFSNLRMVPYRFASRCPPLASVERFIRWFGDRVPPEHRHSSEPFYVGGVGIWLVHRDLWHESGGYDERMVYMNGMETNMIRRLMLNYPIADLGRMTNYGLYHLEHYHPLTVRKSSAHRKVNPHLPFAEPDRMRANDDSWGLADQPLTASPGHTGREDEGERPSASRERLSFVLALAAVGPQLLADRVFLAARNARTAWPRRAHRAWSAVSERPVIAWPGVLLDLWRHRVG